MSTDSIGIMKRNRISLCTYYIFQFLSQFRYELFVTLETKSSSINVTSRTGIELRPMNASSVLYSQIRHCSCDYVALDLIQ